MRRVATRLGQHQLTKLVVVRFDPAHLFQDRSAGDVADAAGDHPHRDARMGVDGGDHALEGHRSGPCIGSVGGAARAAHRLIRDRRAIP